MFNPIDDKKINKVFNAYVKSKKEQRFTARDIAKLLKIHSATYVRWEKGESPHNVKKLQDAMKIMGHVLSVTPLKIMVKK